MQQAGRVAPKASLQAAELGSVVAEVARVVGDGDIAPRQDRPGSARRTPDTFPAMMDETPRGLVAPPGPSAALPAEQGR
jgi:hypothetical protein